MHRVQYRFRVTPSHVPYLDARAEKGIAYCYECAEFPCDYLHPYADQASFRQHNTKPFNLCLIKKMGIEQWAVDKAANVKETYFSGKLKVHGTDKEEQKEPADFSRK